MKFSEKLYVENVILVHPQRRLWTDIKITLLEKNEYNHFRPATLLISFSQELAQSNTKSNSSPDQPWKLIRPAVTARYVRPNRALPP